MMQLRYPLRAPVAPRSWEFSPVLAGDPPVEIVTAVQNIVNTAKGHNSVGLLHVQPVDSTGKPCGPSIDLDTQATPAEEIGRVARELSKSGHFGGLTIEPENPATGLRKWFTCIDKPRPASGVMEPGTVLVAIATVNRYDKGHRFVYHGRNLEIGGHTLVARTGETVTVSDADLLTRLKR